MVFDKPKHIILFVSVLMVIATVYVFTHATSPPAEESHLAAPAEPSAPAGAAAATNNAIDTRQPIQGEDELHMMAGYFRQEFGTRIHNPYWQLKMLEKLMLMLRQKYPDSWEEKLREILLVAFPEMVDMLMKKLASLNEYGDWLNSLKGNMTFVDQTERRRAMWDKRVALFGDEAYTIWEAQYKDEQFADKLSMINQSTQGFAEKSQQYIGGMKEVFGDNALQGGHTTQKIGRFLELPSIQADLAQMPQAQRREELRNFRKSMGLDDAALQRWDALDNERDQIRAAGDHYMQQRAQLEQQYHGEALTQKLTELQDQVFGPTEARYIRNEELSGYYRFNHPQNIGFN